MVNTVIKSKRIVAGLSLTELSERTGICLSSLSKYENGHGLPSYQSLQKLAAVLSCSYLDLGPFNKDLRGKCFGNLTVISFTGELDAARRTLWECECSCGNRLIRSSTSITTSKIGICDECYRKLYRVELQGLTIGQLKVLEKTGRKKYGRSIWKCECSCGEVTEVDSGYLRNAKIPSCSKCRRERMRADMAIKRESIGVDGTVPARLVPERPLNANNTSGVNGVYLRKRKSGLEVWGPEIRFRGKHYTLGAYTDKDDAVAVRKMAEELLYKPYTKWKAQQKESAQSDFGDYSETVQFHKFMEWYGSIKCEMRNQRN